MSRSDDSPRPRAPRGSTTKGPSLEETVSARARDIAGAARFQGGSFGAGYIRPLEAARPAVAPAWLSRALGYLPEPLRIVLRDALGPGDRAAGPSAYGPEAGAPADDPAPLREHLRQQRDDLRHREAALDAARGDLDQARRQVEENRREVDARTREAQRLLAEARRAAEESVVERRVPLGGVQVHEGDNPRPLRGVERLAANIKRFGQLTPVVVRADGEGYRLVTGFRRMAALRAAGVTHVNIRILASLDDRMAAALYIAENCLPEGISSKAVSRLAAQFGDTASPAFAAVLAEVQSDDEAVVEALYLDELAAEACQNLAEGAAWVAALRPHWGDLEADDRQPLVDLLTYFAKVAARIQAGKR